MSTEIEALKAERDALVARNHELIGLVLRMRDRWWPFVHGSVAPSNTAYQLGKESADIISKTPQQCLRDVQAEAGRKGYLEGVLNYDPDYDPEWSASQYAETVRQGGE